MSNQFIPIMCVVGLLAAPMAFQPKKVPFTSDSKGIVRSDDFTLKVTNVNTSNSGVVYCTFYNEKTNKTFIGACTTTDDLKLKVGSTYSIGKSKISSELNGNTISINQAELIEGGSRLKVVATFVRARTSLAELENGHIIGGEGLSVGDYVSVD